jgi:predicted SAM-dependent methyltransferase
MPKTKIEQTSERQANDWVNREGKKSKPDARLVKEKNPLVEAANQVFRKQARRKVN